MKSQYKAPGKSYRTGISLIELSEMFPDEDAAREWFEAKRWPDGKRPCPHCEDGEGKPVPNAKPMPYRCRKCHQFFSVRTGTVLERSKIPLKKWAYAIYLSVTSLKGVSSMKLHRDIGVSQKTAWFLAHRIREAWELDDDAPPFSGPVEVDETYIGGKEENKHSSKKLHAGSFAGKVAVVGIKDRDTNEVAAKPVARTDGPTLKGFVKENTQKGTEVFTDDHAAYRGLPQHTALNHSTGEYVDGMAHTNGIESFWALLKRGYHGTYHKMSAKHLGRYVNEFAGRHNLREQDTAEQMESVFAGVIGKRLMFKDLIAKPEARGSDVF